MLNLIDERLKLISSYVFKSDIPYDIGCDHCYLLIYLIITSKIKKGFASDKSRSAIQLAQINANKYQLNANNLLAIKHYDGISDFVLKSNVLIISGMGVSKIIKIILTAQFSLLKIKKIICQINGGNIFSLINTFPKSFYFDAYSEIIVNNQFYSVVVFKRLQQKKLHDDYPSLLKITKYLNHLFPLKKAEPWDRCGIFHPTKSSLSNIQIQNIILCLDITPKLLQKAKSFPNSLLISHHPIFLDKQSTFAKFILSQSQHQNIYFLHTNFDLAPLSLNHYLANKLCGHVGIPASLEYGRIITFASGISIKQLILLIKAKFNLKTVNIAYSRHHDAHKSITKVAIIAGAGSSFFNDYVNHVDVFISSEIKHHLIIESYYSNTSIIQIPHYLEQFGNEYLELILKKYLNIKIISYLQKYDFPKM